MGIRNVIQTVCVGIALAQGNATPQTVNKVQKMTPQTQATIFETTTTIINDTLESTGLTNHGKCIFPKDKFCKTVKTNVRDKVLACVSLGKTSQTKLYECYAKKAHAHYADLKGQTMKGTTGINFKNLNLNQQLLFNFYMNFLDDEVLKTFIEFKTNY